jgi:2'-5' RNA ligase
MGDRRGVALRLFVALDPPVEVCAEAEAWARHLARSTQGLRVVPARNSHVTLAFLGECDGSEIEPIIEAVAATERPVPGLSLGAPVWLPKRRPRALALEIHDDAGTLREMQAALARELNSSLGWKEGRPYRPHLTCGRTGRSFDGAGARLPVSPSFDFDSESVTLYSSILSPEGAEYEAIERFPAGSGSA